MAQRLDRTDLFVGTELYDLLRQSVHESKLASLLMDAYTAAAVVTTESANYLDVASDGRIGFMPASRLKRALDEGKNPMTEGGRQTLSAGKGLRRIIKPECFTDPIVIEYGKHGKRHTLTVSGPISDADVERLAVIIQSRFRAIDPFIVTGEAIRYWYWEGSYTEEEESSLHLSCMRYSTNWHQTRWYARSPRTIGMLCATGTDDGIVARAILWNGPDGILMDRVYGTDQTRRAFRRFAKERGWAVRDDDAADTRTASGGFFATPIQPISRDAHRPYLDTMDITWYRASGHADWEVLDRHLTNGALNPIEYVVVTCNAHHQSINHPLASDGQYDGRVSAAKRDLRVDFLSNFSAIPPWPDDLLRTNPAWTLKGHSDPENDEENWARLPPRRTEAAAITRREPRATVWTTPSTSTNDDPFSLQIAAIGDAFAGVPLPTAQAGPPQPTALNPFEEDDIPF